MLFYSTNHQIKPVSLTEAVLTGMPADGGLFMPERIPVLPSAFLNSIREFSYHELAGEIAKSFLAPDISDQVIREIITEAHNFRLPVVPVERNVSILELFHGPTLSFKDFGSRFMARLMSYLVRNQDQELTILVATSGDTGSAVADGFLQVDGIKVIILYPSAKISQIQEKQIATLGNNITALEIDGTFDDCQRMVKQAFTDNDLRSALTLTSANSINLARLIPQTFYYAYVSTQYDSNKALIVSVPCGNFGNLCAGLIAKRMGFPISRFVSATNINDVFPRYLDTGIFTPQPSRQTISNAMDVGNPSNLSRILELYGNNAEHIRQDIISWSFTDEQTLQAIDEVYKHSGYIMDPHAAVGYLGLKRYREDVSSAANGIFLGTAHPAKFISTYAAEIREKILVPERLKAVTDRDKLSIPLPASYSSLKELLIS